MCKSCGSAMAREGGPYSMGGKWGCTNPYCSTIKSAQYNSGGGGGGSDWLHKPCASRDCTNEVHYKDDWDNPPNYCKECKNAPRAGTLSRDKSGNFHQLHGRGNLRPDGGVKFAGDQIDHSHHKMDRHGNPIGGGREIGEEKWKK